MNTTIRKENLHTGNKSTFYTAKASFNNVNFNITYDCSAKKIIVHEWYKFSSEQLATITTELTGYFCNKAA